MVSALYAVLSALLLMKFSFDVVRLLEYGTLVPMRYMNEDKHFKVVSISAFCTVHDFADSRKLGEAILKAIEQYDGTVAVLASGSLSHRFIDDQRAEEGMNSYTREFDRQMDERVVKLWSLYYRDVACTRTDRHHSCAKNAGTSGCCTSARFLWSQ